MMRIFKAIAKSVFPQRCAYCGKVITPDRLMCKSCENDLPGIKGKICMSCGREVKLCSCKGETYYDAIVAPFYFEGMVRRGVHVYKFRNGIQNADAYAFEMSKTVKERYKNIKFDFIIPVPMTDKSVRKRGYNQVGILGNKLSEILGIECMNDVLVKLYETEKQHGISYLLRKGNLTGAFDVINCDAVKDKTILLCDDISTSGETFNECAKMLWLYDAKEIYCISLALTKPHRKKHN